MPSRKRTFKTAELDDLSTSNPYKKRKLVSSSSAFTASTTSDKSLYAPELEGKFKIIGKIDYGGYAIVYKAIDLQESDKPHNIVAIKRVHQLDLKDKTKDPVIEIELLDKFSSFKYFPNWFEILHDKSSGSYSIIMEYFPHKPFKTYCSLLTEIDVIQYLYILLKCINVLSASNYIHRDIKPQNFLYNPKLKQYLLIDFGLCQKIKQPTNFNKRKKKRSNLYTKNRNNYYLPGCDRYGTPGFRAPEVILKSKNHTSKIDVYNVGLILACIILGVNTIFNPKNDLNQLEQFIAIYGWHNVYNTAKSLNREIRLDGLTQDLIYQNNGINDVNSGTYVTGYERCCQNNSKLSYWIKRRINILRNKNIKNNSCDDDRKEDRHNKLKYKREWSDDIYDLLDKLTEFNPKNRPTACEALQHKLFRSVHVEGL